MDLLNALSLEYQRDYGSACGDLDIANLVNNPEAGGVCRILGLTFSEETGNLILAELGMLSDHRRNPALVLRSWRGYLKREQVLPSHMNQAGAAMGLTFGALACDVQSVV